MAQWLELGSCPKGAGSSPRRTGGSVCILVIYFLFFPGSTFCANFKSYFGVRSIPALPQQHVKDPRRLSAQSAGGRLLLTTHAPYLRLCLKLHCKLVHGCIV